MSTKLTYSIGTPLPENVIEFKLYGDPKVVTCADKRSHVAIAKDLASRLVEAVEYLYGNLSLVDDKHKKCFLIKDKTGQDLAYVRYE